MMIAEVFKASESIDIKYEIVTDSYVIISTDTTETLLID